MSALTAAAKENDSQRSLSATLRELCHFLTSFPNIQMSAEDCEALAVAAVSGHPEAEFMIGSVYDAAEEPARAMEWYWRAASRDYMPAMLQLFAVR
jgi:TPR repeat protein